MRGGARATRTHTHARAREDGMMRARTSCALAFFASILALTAGDEAGKLFARRMARVASEYEQKNGVPFPSPKPWEPKSFSVAQAEDAACMDFIWVRSTITQLNASLRRRADPSLFAGRRVGDVRVEEGVGGVR